MKYKAVIFDLFGTLIDKLSLQEHRMVLAKMAITLSAPAEDFVRWWFRTFDERGLGLFRSVEANVEYVCRKLGLPVDVERVKSAAGLNAEYTVRAMVPRPGALETLSRLKLGGYKIGLITDCSSDVPPAFAGSPMAPFFDVAMFSCLVGVNKPAPLIYQSALKQLSVKPTDCLYVGDGDSYELTGATGVGMDAVLIRNPDEVTSDVHRVDAEAEKWRGPVIISLKDVLTLL